MSTFLYFRLGKKWEICQACTFLAYRRPSEECMSIKEGKKKSHFTVIYIAEEDKKLNATYIISVARKLGCSIFLLPEDIIEVSLSL